MEPHMIAIEQLRYVRLGTGDLSAAVDFAKRILGLELVEATDEQATFRSDFRDHTLAFVKDATRAQTVGVEVRDTETLERAAEALSRHSYDVNPGSPDAAAERKVKAFLTFKDEGGIAIDLVVRPLHSGWRYFPSRDAGITGLEAVALRSPAIVRGETLWTKVLGGRVSNWVGDAAYIRFDAHHHRLALHPSAAGGVLAVEFGVESIDQLMQSSYFLQDQQVRIVHGPGRRPASGQMFLTFAGPDGVLFSYVAEGQKLDENQHRPRQFPRRAQSFCSWGSRSEVIEFKSDDNCSAVEGGGL
jgi:2,3-dihydroxy-p-cumate/2,3-dihydroxybenzoate 3,4-dioxygenase